MVERFAKSKHYFSSQLSLVTYTLISCGIDRTWQCFRKRMEGVVCLGSLWYNHVLCIIMMSMILVMVIAWEVWDLLYALHNYESLAVHVFFVYSLYFCRLREWCNSIIYVIYVVGLVWLSLNGIWRVCYMLEVSE